MQKVDIIILAGGLGSRIKKYNKVFPKPFIKINNKPFIQYIINHVSKYRVANIFILAGHKGKFLKHKYDNTFHNLIKINCIIEKKRKDTGGALFALSNKIKNNFIVINGDTFFDIDYSILVKKKFNKNTDCFIVLKKKFNKNIKLNNLNISKNKVFLSKKSNYINCGIYFFKKNFIKKIKNKKLSLENFYVKNLINQGKVEGLVSKNYLIDIGTPKDLLLAKRTFEKKFKRPAIFFDRDNVLINDNGYIFKKKDLKFKYGVISGLQKLIKKKYYIFIVTNQAGIAKKKFSLKQFVNFQKILKEELLKKKIFINEVKFCPHHQLGVLKKYALKCNCRKPRNQMFKDIIKNWDVDLKRSFMIGDKKTDEIFAYRSNLKFQYSNKNLNSQIEQILK